MNIKLFLTGLFALLLGACATIPQETVDLSTSVGKGLEAQQALVDKLIDANVERDIRVYRDAKRPTIWNRVTVATSLALIVERGGTSLQDSFPTKQGQKILPAKVPLLGEDHQLIGRVQKFVDDEIETKIKDAWEVSRKAAKANTRLLLQMNKAVTENIVAHRTLQLKQREIFTQVAELADINVSKVDASIDSVLTYAAGLDSVINAIRSDTSKPVSNTPPKGK